MAADSHLRVKSDWLASNISTKNSILFVTKQAFTIPLFSAALLRHGVFSGAGHDPIPGPECCILED